MKLKNELIHKVKITNEDNDVVEIEIDSADMIQVANIGNLFDEFEKLRELEVKDNLSFADMLAALNKVADQMQKVNGRLDDAFGKEVREKAFKGSSSLIVYNEFFHQLGDEMTAAGVKIKNYVKEVRKKDIIGKGKTPKDTI